MPGPPPNKDRRRRNVPELGDWQAAPGIGWQHGAIPKPPPGLVKSARDAWQAWFQSWWAAHWTPDNLPQLRSTVRLYDAFERGDFKAAAELRQWMFAVGISPLGQQKLRWLPPKAEDEQKPAAPKASQYAHLKVVND